MVIEVTDIFNLRPKRRTYELNLHSSSQRYSTLKEFKQDQIKIPKLRAKHIKSSAWRIR